MVEQITESAIGNLAAAGVKVGRKFRARIIQGPRWGSSGYYSAEALQEAANDRVFGEGTPVFLDHPGVEERDDRPERSVRDLAGHLSTDAVWESDGLYADVTVYPHVAPIVEAMADHIGMSIRARGEAMQGEAEGRRGQVITKLTEGISVDFVTAAGAGGKITQLLESAREQGIKDGTIIVAETTGAGIPAKLTAGEYVLNADALKSHSSILEGIQIGDFPTPAFYEGGVVTTTTMTVPAVEQDESINSPEGESMPEISEADKALTEAREQVAALETERDQLTKRAEAAEAELSKRDLCDQAAVIAKEAVTDLPEIMADRIVAEAMRDLPRLEDGKLDADKFGEDLSARVEAEKKYAEALAPQGVIGFGKSAAPAGVTESDVDKAIARAFGRQIKEA